MNQDSLLTTNIKYLMYRKDVRSLSELAKQVKIPQPTLHRIISGEVRDPKYLTIKQLATFFKVPLADLVEIDLSKTPSANATTLTAKLIRVVGDIYGSLYEENDFIIWLTEDREAYSLICSDESLAPRIKKGEYVIIEPSSQVSPGDEVLLDLQNETKQIKTFLYERDNVYHFISINENELPIKLDTQQISKMSYISGIAKTPNLSRSK